MGLGILELVVVVAVVAIVVVRFQPRLSLLIGLLLAALLVLPLSWLMVARSVAVGEPALVTIGGSALERASLPPGGLLPPHQAVSLAQAAPPVARISFVGLLLLVLFTVGAVMLISRLFGSQQRRGERQSDGTYWHEDARRGGWGWGVGLVGAAIFLGLFGVRALNVVELRTRPAENSRRSVGFPQPSTRATPPLAVRGQTKPEQSLDELIESFDEPRIQLEGDPVDSASAEASASDDDLSVPLTAEAAPETRPQSAESVPEIQPFTLAGAAQDDTVLIQLDANKLREFGLSFADVSTAIYSKLAYNGSGRIRVNANRQSIALGVPAAKRIGIGEFVIDKNGKEIPLRAVASLSLVSVAAVPDGPRPTWVDRAPPRKNDVLFEVLSVGEFSTVEECRAETETLIRLVIFDRLQSLLPAAQRSRRLPQFDLRRDENGRIEMGIRANAAQIARTLERMGVGPDFIRRRVVPADGEYIETVDRSIGPMKRLYTRLEFTSATDDYLKQAWIHQQQEGRVAAVGGVGAGVVSLVILAWGLLVLDTATKGYYSKRLFLGVPAVILGLLALFLAATA